MSSVADHHAIEDWVVSTCQELGLSIVSKDDDLFDAGATSLTVMRLMSRVEDEFGEDALTPEEVIDHSTVREIAVAIGDRTASPAVPATGEH